MTIVTLGRHGLFDERVRITIAARCDVVIGCMNGNLRTAGERMLHGLDPSLTPDLLHALASMGHGDTIAIVDANFPATSTARRLIVLPGVDAPRALAALLTVLPIDDFEPDPIAVMQVVGDATAVPDVVRDFKAVLSTHAAPMPVTVERHAFYRMAEAAFAIVQSGERRFYGNILLRKGVIPPQ
ncbi:MAG TPA: RbsD/FucU domain-containing protein [Acetobacteraceae bacterium]|nr:RbsD/FucU domain-containing protein [Acetobacteraceae bacterium]